MIQEEFARRTQNQIDLVNEGISPEEALRLTGAYDFIDLTQDEDPRPASVRHHPDAIIVQRRMYPGISSRLRDQRQREQLSQALPAAVIDQALR